MSYNNIKPIQKSIKIQKNDQDSSLISDKIWYYSLFGGIAITIIGGIYYLFTIISKQEELSEEQQIEIEEIKQKIKENEGEICTDIAIRILAQINRQVEEIIKKTNSDIEHRRRQAIHNENVYNSVCAEFFSLKESSYNKATNEILGYFNMQISDLKEIMEQITLFEVEKKIFIYNKPSFNENYIPERMKVKEGFIFFGNKFIDEMTIFNNQLSKMNEISHDLTIFKMLVIKIKVDDLLYLKFGMTENQIRYLIFEYSLMDDKEVKSINDKICKYEEMLYLQ